jgi:hypothetical protein
MKIVAASVLYLGLIVACGMVGALADHIGRVPHDLPYWRGVVMKLLITFGMVGGGWAWTALARALWPKRRA